MDIKPPVKFDLSFTPEVDTYIELSQKNNQKPTVVGFAGYIGTDEKSIWAWATKNKKDEQGNTTSELARPKFFAAIKKLEKIQKDNEPKDDELNAKQEMFCQYYATDREFFGNGVQTYIEVYEPDKTKPNWYKSACSAASQILSNTKVIKRINELLEMGGLNDSFVDKQLEFLITQHADFGSKVAAIREYNKLKARIIDKMDLTTKGKALPTPILAGATNVSTNNSDK